MLNSQLSSGLIVALFLSAMAVVAEALLGGFIDSRRVVDPFGRVVVVALMLYVVHRFARTALSAYHPKPKDLLTLAIIMISSLFLIAFSRVVVLSVVSYLQRSEFPSLGGLVSEVRPEALFYAIPYAAGCIAIQVIMGLQSALVFTLALALLLSLYFPGQILIVSFVVMTALVGCLSVTSFRSRSVYLKVGVNITAVAFVMALVSLLIEGDFSLLNAVLRLGGAVIGGGLCVIIVAGTTPLLEYLGGYSTDMTLLEMATLDHPLLKDLSVHAPGTWNHSMVMGMMAEAAANAIGANPVVARVGAYFHDVGKINNPLYFVENQTPGENRHDKLSPSMSALIIRSHVKDGIKLARQHKLPKVLEDMIPQHHGTALIEYFYEKAVREAEEEGKGTQVDATNYTYPGPRPQTKEAGILMLADGIEAATRTISEPSMDRIQGVVQKLINKIFASGELEECELTLQELHSIAKSFTRVLTGIYHQRIAYSEPVEKGSEKSVEKEEVRGEGANSTQGTGNNEKPEVADSAAITKPEGQTGRESKRTKEGDKEDLKRLGLH